MIVYLLTPVPEKSFQPPLPSLPIGLASIAAVAEAEHAHVRVFVGRTGIHAFETALRKEKPDLVGIQTFINNGSLCRRAAHAVRSLYPDCPVIFGGVQATNDPETALVDPRCGVIPGEGEAIFRELLRRGTQNFRETPGLIWQDGTGAVHRNPGGDIVHDLDDLPPVPYHLFYPAEGTPLGHILSHRGCPHHCSHCPLKFRAGMRMRCHSVNRITETIIDLKDRFGIQTIEFYEENFTMYPEFVRELCETLLPLKLNWVCTARISQIDLELARKMADAGCRQIIFGLGSGVRRLQKILGTHEDLETARQLMGPISSFGIETVAAFSLGIPTETRQEFKESVQFALSLQASRIRFEASAPLPGTVLHDTAQSGGRFVLKSWDDYVRPGQIVYVPAGRSHGEFRHALYMAKLKAKYHYFRRRKF